jgi:lantibiotic leader peptide-processing serine protease
MPRHRTVATVALAAMAVIVSSVAASAAPDATSRPRSADTAAQPSGGAQEYVVAFEGDADAARAAIADAGGTVVDVNEDASIALVETGDAGFVRDANATAAVTGVARNHAVGTSRPGMAHRFAGERPTARDRAIGGSRGHGGRGGHGDRAEPLADLQWDMDMIGTDAAHRKATGKGVDVGIIDTGIDASHPDIAPNFDRRRSRNFTMDIPAIDGPCEVATCIDPANVDDGGHGTHVAGTVAGDDNRFGIEGVAPDATLVNLRAGQDSGFFFLYETVAALTEAGNLHLDVVNMSFYTDPWLYNCASRDQYVSGEVSDAELAEQQLTRQLVGAAVTYAADRGVTLVGSAGNEHTDLTAPTRADATSPDFPADIEGNPLAAHPRVVTRDCKILPNESPEVIGVSALGPSTTKADYSNYGLNEVEISAPGGWFRDGIGTPTFQTPGNLVWSSYPLDVAIEEGLANPDGTPTDDFSTRYCDSRGRCGFYTTLQGTSMASPHVAGVAALVVDRYGRTTRGGGKALDPATVRRILERTATDHACPAGGVEIYTDEGRPAEFNAACVGTPAENSLYGEGIVNAARAVGAR